jgi:hypothetical protein
MLRPYKWTGGASAPLGATNGPPQFVGLRTEIKMGSKSTDEGGASHRVARKRRRSLRSGSARNSTTERRHLRLETDTKILAKIALKWSFERMIRRRPNFTAIKARNDAIAWKAIQSRPLPTSTHFGLANSGRPANFVEIERAMVEREQAYGYACDHFLDEFYLFRRQSFFAEEPPASLDRRRRAFLAAVAEFLSGEFQLPLPEWTEKPEYFLAEEWDWVEDQPDFNDELRARISRRRESATPAFRRRNILYEGRNLIRL